LDKLKFRTRVCMVKMDFQRFLISFQNNPQKVNTIKSTLL
jgi:hypothetical protein